MKNKKRVLPDLTSGSILRSLWVLSLPIVLSNLLQTAYQLTDAFWVGQLGAEAVAAVSLSFPIIFLIISLGGGLAIAGTILVSQYKGQENLERVDFVSAQTVIMMLIVSIVLSFVGYFTAEPLMVLMGAGPDVLGDATRYLEISSIGMVFMFGYFVFQSLMRGVGDASTPLYIVFGTVVLNFFLDPLFIMGYGPMPGFGVTGAAMATLLTQGIAAVVGLWLLFSGKYGIHLKMKNLKIDFPLVKKMFFIGLPSSIDQSTRALNWAAMNVLVAAFGTITMAGYGIGGRIFSFVVIPMMGLSMATATLVGQNIGAGKLDRAQEVTVVSSKIAFWFLTAVGIVTFFGAEALVSLFISENPAVVELGALFVKTVSISFGVMGVHMAISGAFTGSGNTSMSMNITIISLWVFQFPLAYILSENTDLGVLGVWIAHPIANLLACLMAIYWLMKGDWKSKRLIGDKKLERDVLVESKVEEGF